MTRNAATHVGHLTDQQYVDLVRHIVGLRPLYAPQWKRAPASGGYELAEMLLRAADSSCTRCGGSGQYDGWETGMRCPCTGLAPEPARQRGPRARYMHAAVPLAHDV